ncbi:hypothetical protein D3C80_1675960 [compost metagenome]
MNRQPIRLMPLSQALSMAALVRMIQAAAPISTRDAQLVPTAVNMALREPEAAAVLTISATTGPGVAISSSTVRA